MPLQMMSNTTDSALSPGPQSLAYSFNSNNSGAGRTRTFAVTPNLQSVPSLAFMPDAFLDSGGISDLIASSTTQLFVPSPTDIDPSAASDFVTVPPAIPPPTSFMSLPSISNITDFASSPGPQFLAPSFNNNISRRARRRAKLQTNVKESLNIV